MRAASVAAGASTAAKALGDLLPNVSQRTLDGQYHDVESAALAPVLIEFFIS